LKIEKDFGEIADLKIGSNTVNPKLCILSKTGKVGIY